MPAVARVGYAHPMRVAFGAGLIFATLLVGCPRERDDKATRSEPTEDADDDPPKKKKRPRAQATSTALVFDEAPAPSARPKLTFDAPTPAPTPTVPARYDFFLEAAHRIAPQLRTIEPTPRIKELAIRRERVNAKLIVGQELRAVELSGDAVLDRGTKQDLIVKTAKELDAHAFALEDVDFAKLSTIVSDAETRAPDGEGLDFAVVRRPLPFGRDVQIRVFLRGGRFVDYTAKGVFIATN